MIVLVLVIVLVRVLVRVLVPIRVLVLVLIRLLALVNASDMQTHPTCIRVLVLVLVLTRSRSLVNATRGVCEALEDAGRGPETRPRAQEDLDARLRPENPDPLTPDSCEYEY